MSDVTLLNEGQNQNTETQHGTYALAEGLYSAQDDDQVSVDEAWSDGDEPGAFEGANGDEDLSDQDSAPQAYAFDAPEGQQLDEVVMGAYGEVARELNLSQDKAQKVIDRMAPVMLSQQAHVLAQARKAWEQASSADQEFGRGRLHENLAVAKKAMDAFGTPALKKLFNESGLGNHPEIIRAFYRAGKTMCQDGIVSGGSPEHAQSLSVEDKFYPNMK